ncbi:MAG: hypothetical protein K0R72_515 [Clostridia bacterium]|jgi:FtsH-binding integral membrane protein|nr:hypothetical protein [Clostridia bacterium]
MENDFELNNVIVTDKNNVFKKTFQWMFMGLLITGLVSWFVYSSQLYIDIVLGGYFDALLIAELVMVFAFSFLLKKCSPTVAGIMFFAYAILNGFTFSVIFALFELTSITILFFAAAGIFGIMALYGYRTDNDLTKIAPLLFTTLFVGILASLVNLFVGNSLLDITISWVMLLVFSGITAYDIQKIKLLSESSSLDQSKIHIYGALELYLDFINIFLRLLSIFGRRK